MTNIIHQSKQIKASDQQIHYLKIGIINLSGLENYRIGIIMYNIYYIFFFI
jgi:hypothetical protein